MDDEVSEAAPEPAAAEPRVNWLAEGMRVACFRAPHWARLNSTPRVTALLVGVSILVIIAMERAMLDGSPHFAWRGAFSGWFSTLVNVWLCWLAAGSPRAEVAGIASASRLFALLCALYIAYALALGSAFFVLRHSFEAPQTWPLTIQWIAWLAPLVWLSLAQMRLLWRVGGGWAARAAILLLTPGALAVSTWLAPMQFWWPDRGADESQVRRMELTQEVVDAQPRLLTQALADLKPQRPGKIDVYALTYAPYSTQDVFMHESAVVARTMTERFDTGGHTVQLVVNPASATTLPWATPDNLHRSIQRMAALMDKNEDVFFIHLTSHGGADGKLAVDTWPLQSESVTPQMLKAWLDEAGIRWRIISVSACYSGSWIAPLAGDGTLVMTAADADHTSYGCGSRSPLTFFGQAMYVEALQQTWNFKAAHARARELIKQREVTAGKTDGYSNPQLSEGAGIGQQLLRLQAELARR